METGSDYQVPIDYPYVKDLTSKIRSQLDVIAEPEVRSKLKESTFFIIRLSLRLLPRDGTYDSQIKHIDDGTARRLLSSLLQISIDLEDNAITHLRETREPIEQVVLLIKRIKEGYRAMLGDWRDIIRCVRPLPILDVDSSNASGVSMPSSENTKAIRIIAELCDLALYHPVLKLLESQPSHPVSTLKSLINDASHILNQAAFTSRASDSNRRFIFRTMAKTTTLRERTLILQSSLGSSGSSNESVTNLSDSNEPAHPDSVLTIANLLHPATSVDTTASEAAQAYPSPASARSHSFSRSAVRPDPIEEPRCSLYRDSVHECETEGCFVSSPMSLVNAMLDDIALLESDLLGDEDDNDGASNESVHGSIAEYGSSHEDDPVHGSKGSDHSEATAEPANGSGRTGQDEDDAGDVKRSVNSDTDNESTEDGDVLMMKQVSPVQVRRSRARASSKAPYPPAGVEPTKVSSKVSPQTGPNLADLTSEIQMDEITKADLLTGCFDGTPEARISVRHERMKSLQRLSGDEASEVKGRRLQRVWSLPEGSLLGSVPERRRRRRTEGNPALFPSKSVGTVMTRSFMLPTRNVEDREVPDTGKTV
ncbi:Hypothetical protein D9617_9g025810 [Elsinoe fawcettii]|nr:Hypothetical protein D9617_9g025810 [Elsinoe fawcettii]